MRAGADAKVLLTLNLTLDATVNREMTQGWPGMAGPALNALCWLSRSDDASR